MKTKNTCLRTIVIILLGCFVIKGCKETPYTPTIWQYPALTESFETQNFVFHFSEGDQIDSIRQEKFHEWAVGQLNVSIPKKVDYFKYKDKEHMHILTGRPLGSEFADPDTFSVHSYQSWHNHECTHLYSSLIGRPSDFYNEGLAMAFSIDPYDGVYEPRYGGQSVNLLSKQYKAEGIIISINKILTTWNFRSSSQDITYPESGSFVWYLIATYGIGNMKSIFQTGYQLDTREVINQKFQSIYGFSIDQAEQEWLIFLDSY